MSENPESKRDQAPDRLPRTTAGSGTSRREFCGKAAIGVAATTIGLDVLLASSTSASAATAIERQGVEPPPEIGSPVTTRRNRSAQIRHEAERYNRQLPVPAHPTNGDEERYANHIASFSKGLPHDSRGHVDPTAYASLLAALSSDSTSAAFENILLGNPDPATRVKLTNPQAGLAFDLQGTDSHQFAMPPAPSFASAEQAGEMTELYWMCLLRDVNFLDYPGHPLAEAAAAELSAVDDFRGPKIAGRVTTETLFRDSLLGATVGPYLSQFFWLPTPFGAERVDRKMRTMMPGSDHMFGWNEWLAIQNGYSPNGISQFDPAPCLLRNGRDLAQWVHVDVLFQASFNAMLILLQSADTRNAGGIGCPLNPGNPYKDSKTQIGFGTFGGPHIATLLCEVATRALKAVWYQKWYVHRRLRPEVFAARVHNHVTRAARYPVHGDVISSDALDRIQSAHGGSLLPMVYPEGSPTHPSYGAGHATVAGACVTILKALFDERYVIPDPVLPTSDGQALVPWTGTPLTVGGELNKLASNVATGRNIAGVHWRSDGVESLELGEAVAIRILRDQRDCYNEEFPGFTFTKFDGTATTV